MKELIDHITTVQILLLTGSVAMFTPIVVFGQDHKNFGYYMVSFFITSSAACINHTIEKKKND